MKTSARFTQAVQKLYTAFHQGQLQPECCQQCAVGSILDGRDHWKHLSDEHGSLQLNYTGKVHQTLGRKFNGYTPLELLQIEFEFLKGCGYQLPLHHTRLSPNTRPGDETLFQGLSGAITVLCKLEGIEDVMDIQKWQAFLKGTPTSQKKVYSNQLV